MEEGFARSGRVTTGERARRYKIEFRLFHQLVISAVKLGKVTQLILVFLLSLIVTAVLMSQVHACSRGQIRRIHLHRCVSVHSELAAPYIRARDEEVPRHRFSRRHAERPWYVNALIPVSAVSALSAPEPVRYRWEWPTEGGIEWRR
jgi:hypothetical protein